MRISTTTVLIPGQMDGNVAFEIAGDRQRVLYSDRYRISGVSEGDRYWFDETFERDPIRIGGSTGWFQLDDEGVRSDVIRSVVAHPLRVVVAPHVEQWAIAPRVLPQGCWTIRGEHGATALLRATGSERVELSFDPADPVVATGPVDAELLSPLVVGLPAHLRPFTAADALVTDPVISIERVRFDRWRNT